MRMHFLRFVVGALAGIALVACESPAYRPGQLDASVRPNVDTPRPKEAPPKLEAFWDDPSYVVIRDQAPCPEGFWALFGGDPPGETKEEQKANLAKKPELKKELEGKTFVVHMQGPDEVTQGEFSNAKGEFYLGVKATVLCKSPSLGNVTIALGPVKAQLPPGKAEGMYYWLGDPVPVGVKMAFAQVPEFKNKHKLDLDARIVFTAGKTEQHKKLIRSAETKEEEEERKKFDIPSRAGGMQDWGAGWVMHGEVKGVRVASDRGHNELATVRKGASK